MVADHPPPSKGAGAAPPAKVRAPPSSQRRRCCPLASQQVLHQQRFLAAQAEALQHLRALHHCPLPACGAPAEGSAPVVLPSAVYRQRLMAYMQDVLLQTAPIDPTMASPGVHSKADGGASTETVNMPDPDARGVALPKDGAGEGPPIPPAVRLAQLLLTSAGPPPRVPFPTATPRPSNATHSRHAATNDSACAPVPAWMPLVCHARDRLRRAALLSTALTTQALYASPLASWWRCMPGGHRRHRPFREVRVTAKMYALLRASSKHQEEEQQKAPPASASAVGAGKKEEEEEEEEAVEGHKVWRVPLSALLPYGSPQVLSSTADKLHFTQGQGHRTAAPSIAAPCGALHVRQAATAASLGVNHTQIGREANLQALAAAALARSAADVRDLRDLLYPREVESLLRPLLELHRADKPQPSTSPTPPPAPAHDHTQVSSRCGGGGGGVAAGSKSEQTEASAPTQPVWCDPHQRGGGTRQRMPSLFQVLF